MNGKFETNKQTNPTMAYDKQVFLKRTAVSGITLKK